MKYIRSIFAAVLVISFAGASEGQWPQFGGPGRDFHLDQFPTIAEWAEAGPRPLWKRELGPGYAALVSDASSPRLFTQSRDGEEELVVALDSRTGDTLWEFRYRAPVADLQGVNMAYGNAPQSSPLLVGSRIYSLGFTGHLHALDASSGKVLWAKDLSADFGVRVPYFGHASSPLLVVDPDNPEDRFVVVMAGGAMAFDAETGASKWQNRTFTGTYSSPILASTPFGPQIVSGVAGGIVGLEPSTGKLLWSHEYANEHHTVIATPIQIEPDLFFVSVYFEGSRGLRLTAADQVEQIWEQPDFQVSHFNAVRQGRSIVSTFKNSLVVLDPKTGEIESRQQRFGSANFLVAGEGALILGEHGRLTTARFTSEGMEQQQQARILSGRSWTTPTVVGNLLFVRNQEEVAAYDLAVVAETSLDAESAHSVAAPAEFREAIVALQESMLRAESSSISDSIATFSAWNEHPELAAWAAYYRGLGSWQLSLLASPGDQVAHLDQAVAEQKRAIELDRDNAEAHALLSRLYSRYYVVDRSRASVIGPLGDEHLARAIDLAPENPRVRSFKGLDLAYSPVQWGGDPVAARRLLEEVLEDFQDVDSLPEPSDARPTWGPAMIRLWLARLCSTQDPIDPECSRRQLTAARQLYPSLVVETGLEEKVRDGYERGSRTASSGAR